MDIIIASLSKSSLKHFTICNETAHKEQYSQWNIPYRWEVPATTLEVITIGGHHGLAPSIIPTILKNVPNVKQFNMIGNSTCSNLY